MVSWWLFWVIQVFVNVNHIRTLNLWVKLDELFFHHVLFLSIVSQWTEKNGNTSWEGELILIWLNQKRLCLILVIVNWWRFSLFQSHPWVHDDLIWMRKYFQFSLSLISFSLPEFMRISGPKSLDCKFNFVSNNLPSKYIR